MKKIFGQLLSLSVFLWLVFLVMVFLMEFKLQNIRRHFFCSNVAVKLLQSLRTLQVFLLNFYWSKSLSSPKRKPFLWHCWNQVTGNSLLRHKKWWSTGTLYFTIFPTFLTTFVFAMKQNSIESKPIHKCQSCGKNFPSFQYLPIHKRFVEQKMDQK